MNRDVSGGLRCRKGEVNLSQVKMAFICHGSGGGALLLMIFFLCKGIIW